MGRHKKKIVKENPLPCQETHHDTLQLINALPIPSDDQKESDPPTITDVYKLLQQLELRISSLEAISNRSPSTGTAHNENITSTTPSTPFPDSSLSRNLSQPIIQYARKRLMSTITSLISKLASKSAWHLMMFLYLRKLRKWLIVVIFQVIVKVQQSHVGKLNAVNGIGKILFKLLQ